MQRVVCNETPLGLPSTLNFESPSTVVPITNSEPAGPLMESVWHFGGQGQRTSRWSMRMTRLCPLEWMATAQTAGTTLSVRSCSSTILKGILDLTTTAFQDAGARVHCSSVRNQNTTMMNWRLKCSDCPASRVGVQKPWS